MVDNAYGLFENGNVVRRPAEEPEVQGAALEVGEEFEVKFLLDFRGVGERFEIVVVDEQAAEERQASEIEVAAFVGQGVDGKDVVTAAVQ